MGDTYFLIVDDEANLAKINARLASRFFLECGRSIETIVAHSGPEALRVVEEKLTTNPNAEWGLLSDYDMPDMNGSQLIDQLDAMLGDKLVFRVVATADLKPDRKIELEAKQVFVDQKPLDLSALESHFYTFLMSLT